DTDDPLSGHGYLIDFDYAIKTSRKQPSGAVNRTGTPLFMAPGICYREPSNHVYDLQSFFYVLLYSVDHYLVDGKEAI
ncbi:hypothetical protein BJ508DRAFT_189201, partial [Ascobolus immersus RN42]